MLSTDIILLTFFSIPFALLSFQIARFIYFRFFVESQWTRSIFSSQNLFIAQCWVWCVIRIVGIAIGDDIPVAAKFCFDSLPTFFQTGVFSLLTFYFHTKLFGRSVIIKWMLIGVNAALIFGDIFLGFLCILSVMSLSFFLQLIHILVFLVYLSLSVWLMFFSWKMRRTRNTLDVEFPSYISERVVSIAMAFLSFIFLSRAALNAAAIAEKRLVWSDSNSGETIYVFLLTFWEILPILFVYSCFGRIKVQNYDLGEQTKILPSLKESQQEFRDETTPLFSNYTIN